MGTAKQPIYTDEFEPGEQFTIGELTVIVLQQRSGRKVRIGLQGRDGLPFGVDLLRQIVDSRRVKTVRFGETT